MGMIETNTPYDDVCRTLTVECNDLVIPLEQQGGAEEKRITDSLLEIVSSMTKQGKKYHLECESSSSDGTILMRIFEYAAQIALDEAVADGEELIVEFPHFAVIYLRSKKRRLKQMKITVRTPGGETAYYIPVLHVRDYTIDAIFEKKLYFLIPFFIFNIETELSEIEMSTERLGALKAFYADIVCKLEGLVLAGELTEF